MWALKEGDENLVQEIVEEFATDLAMPSEDLKAELDYVLYPVRKFFGKSKNNAQEI